MSEGYTIKSNCRRAARRAGFDADTVLVEQGADGLWRWSERPTVRAEEVKAEFAAAGRATPRILFVDEIDECERPAEAPGQGIDSAQGFGDGFREMPPSGEGARAAEPATPAPLSEPAASPEAAPEEVGGFEGDCSASQCGANPPHTPGVSEAGEPTSSSQTDVTARRDGTVPDGITGKARQLAELALRPEGVTVAEAGDLLHWQPHTTRGRLSDLGRKGGLAITTEQVDGRGRVYRASPSMQGDLTI